MTQPACPQCASLDARSLSYVYREGLSALPGPRAGRAVIAAVVPLRSQMALAKHAAPPRRRTILGWVAITVLYGILVLTSTRFDVTTAACAAVAVAAAWRVRANRVFNAAEFPARYQRWQHSLMCTRCGAVYSNSGSHRLKL